MLLQGLSEAVKRIGDHEGTEELESDASHDNSSCTSQGSALGSESSESSQLDPALPGQLAGGVTPTTGVQSASRNAAEDSIKAAEPDAEQAAILAELHLFSRYAILLCCLLCITLHVDGACFLLWPCTGHSCLHLWHVQIVSAWATIEGTLCMPILLDQFSCDLQDGSKALGVGARPEAASPE